MTGLLAVGGLSGAVFLGCLGTGYFLSSRLARVAPPGVPLLVALVLQALMLLPALLTRLLLGPEAPPFAFASVTHLTMGLGLGLGGELRGWAYRRRRTR